MNIVSLRMNDFQETLNSIKLELNFIFKCHLTYLLNKTDKHIKYYNDKLSEDYCNANDNMLNIACDLRNRIRDREASLAKLKSLRNEIITDLKTIRC